MFNVGSFAHIFMEKIWLSTRDSLSSPSTGAGAENLVFPPSALTFDSCSHGPLLQQNLGVLDGLEVVEDHFFPLSA
jgi:hypothetical protein